MSSQRGFMDLVSSVEVAEGTAAGTRLRLYGKETVYRIPRDRSFDLHTETVHRRQGKPVYLETVETEAGAEQAVSRILIPQLRRVAEIRVGPFHVEVRAKGSPLKLVLPFDLFKELEDRLREAVQGKSELLITDDPETHEILDVSDPFDFIDRGEDTQIAAPPAGSAPLSLSRAREKLEFLARACKIPFDYPDEYCNARAHQMFRRLRERGVACEKIWNFGGEGEPLDSRIRVFTPDHRDGMVSWGFHVALLVKVRLSNLRETVVDMVFDPVLADRPLRIPDWVALQHDSTAVQERTRPEIFDQAAGGRDRAYDDLFEETEYWLDKANFAARKRRLELRGGA